MTYPSKVCFKCGIGKPLTDFYTHKRMRDGYFNKCKVCTKYEALLRRKIKATQIAEYEKSRANLPHRVELRKRYLKTEKGKEVKKSANAAWIRRNPEKRRCHIAVGNALRDGKISKPTLCEGCHSRLALQAHHEDYSKPLLVKWLCKKCHDDIHWRFVSET